MDIKDQVRQFIVTNFYVPDPAALSDDASLLDSGIIDSTGVLEVISFIEDNYELSVEEADMVPENLDSVARISAYVARQKG
jgi:acyl carrier protein